MTDKETIEKVQKLTIENKDNFIVLYYDKDKVHLKDLYDFFMILKTTIKECKIIVCEKDITIDTMTKDELNKLFDLTREETMPCDFCGEEYVVMSGSRMTADAMHKGCTANYCPKCGRKLKNDEG